MTFEKKFVTTELMPSKNSTPVSYKVYCNEVITMLVKSNSAQEKNIINELTKKDTALMRQHQLFLAEMAFKQELINKRKANSLTQKDISERSGLSQQAVSRLEKGTGGTIETILRYLGALGCSLTVKES